MEHPEKKEEDTWFRSFVRFLYSGAFNTLITWVLYLLLIQVVSYRIGYSLVFIAGILLAYYLNRHFVFRSQAHRFSLALFAGIYLIQYLLGLCVVSLWIDVLGWSKELASLAATAISIPITFVLTQRLFQSKHAKPEIRGVFMLSPLIRRTGIPILLLLIIGVLAYWPALHGFFLSDDFVHVHHMRRMDTDILVLLKNFWSNWLDVPTTLFYRPLVSVTLYMDHLLWDWRPAGFHLTNILMHTCTGGLVFLIGQDLTRNSAQSKAIFAPGLSALLFLLSPLHPEAVYWIIGRVDVQVTFLYLLAVFLFVRHRQYGQIWPLLASLLAYIAALMTKEIAVTLPAITTAYAFLYPASEVQPRLWNRIISALKVTGAFWGILGGYFLWRHHVLGTFGGGYMGQGVDFFTASYWKSWQALLYLLLPINQEWPASANTLHLVSWLFLTGWGLLVLAIIRGIQCHRLRKAGLLFGLIAFLITLLPLATVFNIGRDLQSSRFLYLPSTFVWIGIAASEEPVYPWRTHHYVKLVAGFMLVLVSAWQLRLNLQPWTQASNEIRILSRQLDEIAAERKHSTRKGLLVLTGIPDSLYGAQFLRNGYGEFLGKIFRPLRIDNVLPLTDNDRTAVMPIYARKMFIEGSLFGAYRYSPQKGIQRIANTDTIQRNAICNDKMDKVTSSSDVRRTNEGWIVVGPDPYLVFDVAHCDADAVDALRVQLMYSPPADIAPQGELQVFWSSAGKPFSEAHSLSLPLTKGPGQHEYSFPLGSTPTWDAGSRLSLMRIDFPSAIGGRVTLGSVGFVPSPISSNLPDFPPERLAVSDLTHVASPHYAPIANTLEFKLEGHDEFIVLPRQRWNPLQADVLVVRMRITGTSHKVGKSKLYWRTEQSPDFAEDKTAEFVAIADGEWHSYHLSLKHLPTWWTMGTGTQLRLNPFDGMAKVEIASIKLDSAQPQPMLLFTDMPGMDENFRPISRERNRTISLHYQAIEGAKASILQVSNHPFSDPLRSDDGTALEYERELDEEQGTVTLDLSVLKGPGMRYLRIIPYKQGEDNASYASDPVALLLLD